MIARSLDAMAALERGATANEDEGRMVGHYWLRTPDLAPTATLRTSIREAISAILRFADAVRSGAICGVGGRFLHFIHVGIGGSALGPQLLQDALAPGADSASLHVYFLDNADTETIDRMLTAIGPDLNRTLVSVVSKSGWTPTTMHLMGSLRRAYTAAEVDFPSHAISTSAKGTPLDVQAREEGWRARFPLWDWVGGRTSVTSAVALVPAAVRGVDVLSFLDGAAAMDRHTRGRNPRSNPALLLALAWHRITAGRGEKDMVILPYKDRLSSLPRYIQQLVMESLGKERSRSGKVVHQGLTVYGNKGATDQHAYMQQVQEGRNDAFVTFIRVLNSGRFPFDEIEPGITLDDYLAANCAGARRSLDEHGRASIMIDLPNLTPATLGALIALYERAVGFYAEFVDVNAYHQPGVDKDVARYRIELQAEVMKHLRSAPSPSRPEDIARDLGRMEDVGDIDETLERLSADPTRGVTLIPATDDLDRRFSLDPVLLAGGGS